MAQQGHIVPYRTFVLVWLALLVLTVITVAVTRIEVGAWKIWTALGIATVKSALVVFFFMHMKYEPLYYRIYLYLTLLILAIFIGLTFSDVHYRITP